MNPLETVLTEAREALTITKSQDGQRTMRIVCRALEAILYDRLVTQHPPRHHGADDGLGLRQEGPS
jgi:hypothetical protein